MVALVVKLDRINNFESGLKDIFSTPIVSTFFLSGVYVYLTYELPSTPDHQSLGTLALRFTSFVGYIGCSFISILNYWGIFLVMVAIYKFIERHNPHFVNGLKEQIKSLFM